jgi:hypothetical protein
MDMADESYVIYSGFHVFTKSPYPYPEAMPKAVVDLGIKVRETIEECEMVTAAPDSIVGFELTL